MSTKQNDIGFYKGYYDGYGKDGLPTEIINSLIIASQKGYKHTNANIESARVAKEEAQKMKEEYEHNLSNAKEKADDEEVKEALEYRYFYRGL